MNESNTSTSVPAALLAILVCPADHGGLRDEASHLVCESCGRRYPVQNGVPDMIIDHAGAPDGTGDAAAPPEEKPS